MKNVISVIAILILIIASPSFAVQGGEGNNTGCNGVGNANSPCGGNDNQGESGQDGENGSDGVDGQDGIDGKDGSNGAKGDKGVKGDTGKGLKDRYNVLIGARLYDGKKWVSEVHGGRDFNNSVNIMEVRFTRKFGKSYTEKRIEELESRLNALETVSNSETYFTETGIGIREK